MWRGMNTGHPESDADKAVPQWDILSGTCSYQIKQRPQKQPAHQWQGSASQPHPACPWPEVELGPLWQSSSSRTRFWSSGAALLQCSGWHCPIRWHQEQGKKKLSTKNDWKGSKSESLDQSGIQWALRLQAKSWHVHTYTYFAWKMSPLFSLDSPKDS